MPSSRRHRLNTLLEHFLQIIILPPIPSAVSRDLISCVAQNSDDVFSETTVSLHHQESPCFVVHNARFLGWCQTVTGFNSGWIGVRPSPRFSPSDWSTRIRIVPAACYLFGGRTILRAGRGGKGLSSASAFDSPDDKAQSDWLCFG